MVDARSMAALEKFQPDPHWRDYILFYEYFHGDNGAGLGASHQTGWTGTIARIMQLFALVPADQLLKSGAWATMKEVQESRASRRPRSRNRSDDQRLTSSELLTTTLVIERGDVPPGPRCVARPVEAIRDCAGAATASTTSVDCELQTSRPSPS